MEKITNDNCAGMCYEQGCSNKYKYMEKIYLNGLCLIIALCEEHKEQWENLRLTKIDKQTKGGI